MAGCVLGSYEREEYAEIDKRIKIVHVEYRKRQMSIQSGPNINEINGKSRSALNSEHYNPTKGDLTTFLVGACAEHYVDRQFQSNPMPSLIHQIKLRYATSN